MTSRQVAAGRGKSRQVAAGHGRSRLVTAGRGRTRHWQVTAVDGLGSHREFDDSWRSRLLDGCQRCDDSKLGSCFKIRSAKARG